MTTPDPEPTGYAAAVTELEAILSEIERAEVDVDLLAAKVERANALIEYCRARIAAAETALDGAVSEASSTE